MTAATGRDLGVEIVRRVAIAGTAEEIMDLVMDIEHYAEVDDKIAPVLWSRRDGDEVTFACRPRLAGLRQPKVVQTVRLTRPGRIDIALAPRPTNRLVHAVACFDASFVCRQRPGGTEVTRTLRFRFTPVVGLVLAPLFRRRLPAEVDAELVCVQQYFASRDPR